MELWDQLFLHEKWQEFLKYKTEKQFIEYARKAGLVIPQESLERPIHLACTGKALTQSPSVKGLLEKWNDLDCE